MTRRRTWQASSRLHDKICPAKKKLIPHTLTWRRFWSGTVWQRPSVLQPATGASVSLQRPLAVKDTAPNLLVQQLQWTRVLASRSLLHWRVSPSWRPSSENDALSPTSSAP